MRGISEVIFPAVCTVCGVKLSIHEHFVCTFCLEDKFEESHRGGKKSTADIILPDGIVLQHAMWNFDKGGHLQDLLHKFKYNRLTGIGIDLGRQLGKSLLENQFYENLNIDTEAVLIPVPLHPKKRRKRGYNQAYYVAKGVSQVTGQSIIEFEAVKRIKNTRTQTGFSLQKRRDNIDGAFLVERPELIDNRCCIIIDDVFTTGATTFELASKLKEAGSSKILIATIAQA